MDLEQTLVYLNELLIAHRGEGLSEPEAAILVGAWKGDEYVEIAATSKFKRSYLQNNKAPKLWNVLKEVLRHSINKFSFKSYFENFVRAEISWNPVKDESFVGRGTELTQLDSLLGTSQCVQIYGPGGIGKTALMSQWIAENSATQTRWKSIILKPAESDSFRTLALELCTEYGPIKPISEDLIQRFITLLSEQNLLICIESAEELFGAEFGSPEWTENRKIIKAVAVRSHSSCLVFLSRRQIPELRLLASKGHPVGFLRLEGLEKNDAKQLLGEYDLSDASLWTKLVQKYGRNPLALKSIAAYLKEKFKGNIELFDACDTIILGDEVEQILREQCEDLSKGQRKIMTFLSSFYERGKPLRNVSLSELEQDWTGEGLLQSLNDLEDNFLIERSSGPQIAWTLSPMIAKFVRSTPLFSQS